MFRRAVKLTENRNTFLFYCSWSFKQIYRSLISMKNKRIMQSHIISIYFSNKISFEKNRVTRFDVKPSPYTFKNVIFDYHNVNCIIVILEWHSVELKWDRSNFCFVFQAIRSTEAAIARCLCSFGIIPIKLE